MEERCREEEAVILRQIEWKREVDKKNSEYRTNKIYGGEIPIGRMLL